MANLTPAELDNIFIEKVSEKYQLIDRDLKKAFARFDKDGNGQLDLDEMKVAFKLFLNGVSDSQIQSVIDRYDVNGDGKISFEEFAHLMQSRSARLSRTSKKGTLAKRSINDELPDDPLRPNPDAKIFRKTPVEVEESNTAPSRSRSSRQESRGEDRHVRENRQVEPEFDVPVPRPKKQAWTEKSEAELDFTDPAVLEAQAHIFLVGLRGILLLKSREMRFEGKVKDKLVMSHSELSEAIAVDIINKAFQIYTGVGDGRIRKQHAFVGFSDFCKVLRTFKTPGSPSVRMEVLQFLFTLCEIGSELLSSLASGEEQENRLADPTLLVPLIFGDDRKTSGSGKSINNRNSAVANEQALGSTTIGTGLGGSLAKKHQRRSLVGTGPMKVDGAMTAFEAGSGTGIEVVPLRFISHRSKTALTTPADFNFALAKRSAQPPAYECIREHIFGVAPELMGGRILHSMPAIPEAYTGARVSNFTNSQQCVLVYPAASVGVVHDVSTNAQYFFDGHTDDISCIALSNDGHLAATGCVASVGKLPLVKVWETSPESLNSQENGLVTTLGKGFFQRAVNAVAFAFDSTFLVGVGCDDQHMLGVFVLPQGSLVAQAPCIHGTPDIFKDLQYCPSQQFTEWITREHSGPCDVFSTAGEHHLRLWSFKRPAALQDPGAGKVNSTGTSLGLQASINFKSCVLPLEKTSTKASAAMTTSTTSSAPKVFSCVAFSPISDGTYDLLSGASNGMVHCWRKGECVSSGSVIKGGVSCIVAHGDKAVCGGLRGIIKIIDARTIAVIQTIVVSGADAVISRKPNSSSAARKIEQGSGVNGSGSAAASPRPRSSSGLRGGVSGGGSVASTASTPRGTPRSGPSSRPSSAGGGSGSGIGGQSRASSANRASRGPTDANGGLSTPLTPSSSSFDDTATKITSITLVAEITIGGSGSAVKTKGVQLVATTNTGKAVRAEVGKWMGSAPAPSIRAAANSSSSQISVKPIFYYHSGPVQGLAAEMASVGTIMVTGADDKRICIWDTSDKSLIGRTLTKGSVRAIDLDASCQFIAAGYSAGSFSIFSISSVETRRGSGGVGEFPKLITEECFRKDAKEEVSDIKFSPSVNRIAVGSRDNNIYVYRCSLSIGSCALRALHKLSGHSSYITHLDWSRDNELLQSTCGAYELLMWSVTEGKLFTTIPNSDVDWNTRHCVLGFGVMGIWPPGSDGTDINAVDVNRRRGLVVTADDYGFLSLQNYPCVAKNAPRKTYPGHSAHVMNVRLLEQGGGELAVGTVGGRDSSFQLWKILEAAPSDRQLAFESKKASYQSALF